MTAPMLAIPAAELLEHAADRAAAGDSVLGALSAAGMRLHPADLTARTAALGAVVALVATAPEIPDYDQPGDVGHVLEYDATHSRTEMAAVLTACADRARALQPATGATA